MHRVPFTGPATVQILVQDTGTVLALVQDLQVEAGASGTTTEALFQDGVVDEGQVHMVTGPMMTELMVQIGFTRDP